MDRDEILRRVAAGELTPQDALPLLDAAGGTADAPPAATAPTSGAPQPPDADVLSEPATAPSWGTAPHDDEPAAPSSGPAGDAAQPVAPSAPRTEPPLVPAGATRVRINASYRSVDVVGDASVAQVAASGNHTVRLEGGVLVVESQENPITAFENETRRQGGFTFADLPRGIAWAKAWMDQRLVVRVNPDLPVELDAAGASVKVSGLERGAKLRVVASSLKLERVRGPLDLDALSSSVKGFAAPTGASRMNCESSSVKLILGPGSDVTVSARNRMGKVVLPTATSTAGLGDPELSTARVGAGRGELQIDAVMSSVMLTADTDVTTEPVAGEPQ